MSQPQHSNIIRAQQWIPFFLELIGIDQPILSFPNQIRKISVQLDSLFQFVLHMDMLRLLPHNFPHDVQDPRTGQYIHVLNPYTAAVFYRVATNEQIRLLGLCRQHNPRLSSDDAEAINQVFAKQRMLDERIGFAPSGPEVCDIFEGE